MKIQNVNFKGNVAWNKADIAKEMSKCKIGEIEALSSGLSYLKTNLEKNTPKESSFAISFKVTDNNSTEDQTGSLVVTNLDECKYKDRIFNLQCKNSKRPLEEQEEINSNMYIYKNFSNLSDEITESKKNKLLERI